eukprot:gnl/TRDRNA2_/TRDRNA2_168967_c0_seq1.p1 gnl/TRDRNA2_/TRDRNA2_168967_c0~~gnl/TRDRNA2_/TRDRNA2_168967_c0_seq1.p1  ORF type:complete len:443 (-),score=83.23 gnl/TRDRNA2_/TRDRNA2_168967_c0_seq1:80-1408(-)
MKEDIEAGDLSIWQERAMRVHQWWLSLEEPEPTGSLAGVVHSAKFEAVSTIVIVFNATFMAYVANYDIANLNEEPTSFMRSAELFFAIFFCTELILKLIVHGRYFFYNDQMKWNMFDLFLVSLAVYDQIMVLISIESGAANMTFMRTLRMMKMAKMLRVARVLKSFKDLRVMLMCIAGSLMSLFWCFVMLGFVLFMFSLFFVQGFTALLQSENASTLTDFDIAEILRMYGSLEAAVITLFQHVTGGPSWDISYDLIKLSGPLYAAGFVFYLGFFNFAVFNILTGLFVEQAMKCAEPDNEELVLEQRKQELHDRVIMEELCRGMDVDGSGTITFVKFDRFIKSPRGRHLLKLQGLDVEDAETFFKVLQTASECEEVDLHAFVDCALKMKGTASAMDLQILFYETKMVSRRQLRIAEHLMFQLKSANSMLSEISGNSETAPSTM